MAHSNNHAHEDCASFAHPVSVRFLVTIFLALVGLTILTVVANDWPLGAWDVAVAMVIATVKASLVAAFFMHMYWDKPIHVVAFASSFLFVLLFIGLTLMDRDNYRQSVEDFPVVDRPSEDAYLAQ